MSVRREWDASENARARANASEPKIAFKVPTVFQRNLWARGWLQSLRT